MSNRYNIMLIIAIVLCVYYPCIFAPINSVDDPGMYSYLLNTDNFTFKSVFIPGGSGSYYRPLLLTSFLIDKYVWGLEESFMHLDNILIHLCNSLLVYCIVLRVLTNKEMTTSFYPFVAALLFALHPINTESVAWISGRTDPLAAFFLLSSVLFLLSRNSIVGTGLSSICFLFACLAKETAIFFLPVAFLYPFYSQYSTSNLLPFLTIVRRFFYHFIIILSTGLGYFFIRSVAFSNGDHGVARIVSHVGGEQSFKFMPSVIMMLKAIGFYGKKLIIPFPLNFGIMHVWDGYIFIGVVVLLLLLFCLFTYRTLSSFFLFSAVSVASSALLIILIRFTWTPLAERYMYIPSSFLIIGITLAVEQWKFRLRYRNQLLFVIVAVLTIETYGSFSRNLLWQDNLAFFEDTLKKSPNFMPAQNEMATALKNIGRKQEALEMYKLFKKDGDVINYQYGMMNKAGAMADNGDFVGARKILDDVLQTPGKLEIQILEKMMELDKIELLRGKTTGSVLYTDSVKHLTRLYEISGNPFYQYRLGIIHLHEKKHKLALQSFTLVTQKASPTDYYRKPSEKLVKELSK